jgi:hypothetical protein
MEVSSQLHAPVTLHPREGAPGTQSLSGRGGEEKNSRPCPESKLGRPSRSIVTILCELPRLKVIH